MVLMGIAAFGIAGLCEEAPHYLLNLSNENDYLKLVRNTGRVGGIKYTVDLREGRASAYFQNSQVYPYHFPFLKKNIDIYRDLTPIDYQAMIFAPWNPQRKMSVGEVFWVRNWAPPGFSQPGFVGISLYYYQGIDIQEVRFILEQMREQISLPTRQLALVIESLEDFHKYRAMLLDLGVVSLSYDLLEKNGNVIPRGPDRQ